MSKLRVAILGCGGFATRHARQMSKHPDVQIVALCDLADEVLNFFLDACLKDYEPKPALFTDRAAMYEQAQPDAVVIVTPHTLHYQHAVEALDHGCHILVEKPMVTSSRDAHDLASRIEKAGKVLTIGYGTPCTPEFRFLRQLVRDRTLGNLELVSAWLAQNWMDPTRGKWRQDPKLSGGGQAYDSGAHLLNSVCWTVEDRVAEVYAMIDNRGTRVDVNSSINVRFEKGVRAGIVIGGNCPTSASNMMLAFDGGHVEIDGWNGSWIKVRTKDGEMKYPHIDFPAQTPDMNFIDAVLGRAEPLTSPINGVIQSELMDAIYESARIGGPVRPER